MKFPTTITKYLLAGALVFAPTIAKAQYVKNSATATATATATIVRIERPTIKVDENNDILDYGTMFSTAVGGADVFKDGKRIPLNDTIIRDYNKRLSLSSVDLYNESLSKKYDLKPEDIRQDRLERIFFKEPGLEGRLNKDKIELASKISRTVIYPIHKIYEAVKKLDIPGGTKNFEVEITNNIDGKPTILIKSLKPIKKSN